MRYTVCFLFNKDLSKVLLIHKLRNIYAGKLNGVGGKFEPTDTSPVMCAEREIKEETGVIIKSENLLHWLITCNYPSETELWVYYGIVDENEVRQIEDEKLEWFDVNDVLDALINDGRFAGDGNVPYFVHTSLLELVKEKKIEDYNRQYYKINN